MVNFVLQNEEELIQQKKKKRGRIKELFFLYYSLVLSHEGYYAYWDAYSVR